MVPQVLQFVRKHRLVAPGDRLGVAVSGGADSVALLRALLELRPQLGCVLSVVHLHHSLRGADADADAAFVAQLAANHQLEFHCRRQDVAEFARSHRLSVEAAGRRARLNYFAELTALDRIDRVATAHSANDQAETVLLKFLRGAGTRGLAGIYPLSEQQADEQRTATIIRPLLSVTRADIEGYLRTLDQPWREDATNRSPEFLRNRIRHDLLPLLEREFNPNLREILATSAEVARSEQDFWESTVHKVVANLRADERRFDVAGFLSMHVAVQRRVLMSLAPVALDFAHIELAREFILASQAGERPLVRGVSIRLVRSATGEYSFSFLADVEHEQAASAVQFTIPGEVTLPARASRLVARLTENATYGAALDASLAGRTLTIRSWRAGDRFQPLGRSEGKLKDFFQQMHIPAPSRPTWPIAELDGEIVWVLGLPVASRFVAKGSSGIVLEELPASS